MATPIDVPQEAILKTVLALRSETDRGAAVLGGSLVENALGHFLACYFEVHSDRAVAKGSISTFAQRIQVARKLDLIDDRKERQLSLLREIRNHFAHHPLEASFMDEDIRSLIERLPVTTFSSSDPRLAAMGTHRMGFLTTCASNAAIFRTMASHVPTMFPK